MSTTKQDLIDLLFDRPDLSSLRMVIDSVKFRQEDLERLSDLIRLYISSNPLPPKKTRGFL